MKYAEYDKISEKNPSKKLRPVVPFDWPETWSKNGKNEKFFNFRTKLLLGSLKFADYDKIKEKNPSSKLQPVDPWDWPETW